MSIAEVFDFLRPLQNLVVIFVVKKIKLLFLLRKVAPAVGIEPTASVSYLVILCHKVPYLYGYDGYKVSYLAINIH